MVARACRASKTLTLANPYNYEVYLIDAFGRSELHIRSSFGGKGVDVLQGGACPCLTRFLVANEKLVDLSTHNSRKAGTMAKSLHGLFGAATVLALVGGTTIAFGWDYTRPGLGCREPNGIITYGGGTAKNPDTVQHGTFRCPLHRRYPINANLTQMYAMARDRSVYEGVECYVRSCDSLGKSCASSSSDKSLGTSNNVLSMGSVDGDTDGYAYLVCDVPDQDSAGPGDGMSGVNGYKWDD